MFFFRLFVCISGLLTSAALVQAQPAAGQPWRFSFSRPGGLPVYVQARVQPGASPRIWFISDADTMAAAQVQRRGDSLLLEMPLFETRIRLQQQANGRWQGVLLKGTSQGDQLWQAEAEEGAGTQLPDVPEAPATDLSGRWAVQFQRADGSWRPAVAELQQQGGRLTGTVLTPSGDYRFLEGRLSGRRLYLSAFDGAHIYAFEAQAVGDTALADGLFFAGTAPGERFKARRQADAALPAVAGLAELKPGESRLNFRFPDLDSNLVGIADERFRGKVTIVQIMGSWCPNCMDETSFLSEFYNQQATNRPVEIVSLAYELSTDFRRSAASLRKFQQRFGVRYPMLITGARSADPDKAAKTLPQLTDIRFFPTTIFIDKTGRVRKVHNGFYGPGAPAYFEAYKQEFFETLRQLQAE